MQAKNKEIIFDGAGFKAESICVQQFGGKLLSDKESQYKDIDALIESEKHGSSYTVSIKDQLWSSEKYGCIQIEQKLINTRNNKSDVGCFYKSEAQYYFWRVFTKEMGDTWLILDRNVLKQYLLDNAATLKTWATRPTTEAKNRSFNRYYDRTEGVMIPVTTLLTIGRSIPVSKEIH